MDHREYGIAEHERFDREAQVMRSKGKVKLKDGVVVVGALMAAALTAASVVALVIYVS